MENYKLNEFFQNIKLKKQYVVKLTDEIKYLKETKIKKKEVIALKSFNNKENNLVKYIIDITFSRTNTLIHIMDFSGNLKFYCSAGKLNYTGKRKKVRRLVIRSIYKILISKLKYLANQPVALHLKNIDSSVVWIIKLLKKKFFIKIVKIYKIYPSNGCRKKKSEERSLELAKIGQKI